MSESTPPLDVPAADWAEQQTEADPVRDEEATAERPPVVGGAEADEADRAEQGAEVFFDDEEE